MKKFFILISVLWLVSCSGFFDSSEREPSGFKLDLSEISKLSFVGGGLVYHPDTPSMGNITQGSVMALRFSKTMEIMRDSEQRNFLEKADSVHFGLIEILEIDVRSLSLRYNQIEDSQPVLTTIHQLILGESLDLNGDGEADVEYSKPQIPRPNFKNACHLRFLSSKEKGSITMFSLLEFSGNQNPYPGGLVGVTVDGRYLFSDRAMDGTRSVISGLLPGDIIFSSDEQRFFTSRSSLSARQIDQVNWSHSDLGNEDFFRREEFTHSPEELVKEVSMGYPKILVFAGLGALEALNRTLVDPDLFHSYVEKSLVEIPQASQNRLSNQIEHFSQKELVQLNRALLHDAHGFLSPPSSFQELTLLEVFPLMATQSKNPLTESKENIPKDYQESQEDYALSRNRMIQNYQGYESFLSLDASQLLSRAPGPWIQESGGGFSLEIQSPLISGQLNVERAELNLGCRFDFTSTWNSTQGSIALAGLSEIEIALMNLQGRGTHEIFQHEMRLERIPLLSLGPIVFHVGAESRLSVPMDFTVGEEHPLEVGFSFCSLIGKEVSVKAEYGVSWEDWWLIALPMPYFEINGEDDEFDDRAHHIHVGGEGLEKIGLAEITVKPEFSASLQADINDILYAEIQLSSFIQGKLHAVYQGLERIFRLIGEVRAGFHLSAEAGLKFKVPFTDLEQDWELGFPVVDLEETLAYWEVTS